MSYRPALLLVLLVCWPVVASAQSDDLSAARKSELASLRGLRTITLAARGLPANVNKSGLDNATIRGAARSIFDRHNLRLVPDGQASDATFFVTIKSQYDSTAKVYVFLVRAQLRQLTGLARSEGVYPVSTWEREKLLTIPPVRRRLQEVRDLVSEFTDEFARDCLSVNPQITNSTWQ